MNVLGESPACEGVKCKLRNCRMLKPSVGACGKSNGANLGDDGLIGLGSVEWCSQLVNCGNAWLHGHNLLAARGRTCDGLGDGSSTKRKICALQMYSGFKFPKFGSRRAKKTLTAQAKRRVVARGTHERLT